MDVTARLVVGAVGGDEERRDTAVERHDEGDSRGMTEMALQGEPVDVLRLLTAG